MEDAHIIYLERLRNQRGEEELELKLSPDFLDVTEEGLSFDKDVRVSGRASLVEEELILEFEAQTEAYISCTICCQPVLTKVVTGSVIHAVPVSEASSGVWDMRPLIREEILLETPLFAECGGACPEREALSPYLSKPQEKKGVEGQQPFAGLESDI